MVNIPLSLLVPQRDFLKNSLIVSADAEIEGFVDYPKADTP